MAQMNVTVQFDRDDLLRQAWRQMFNAGIVSVDEYRRLMDPEQARRREVTAKIYRESQLIEVWESLDAIIEKTAC